MNWNAEYLIKKNWILPGRKVRVRVEMRSAKTFWGRFGGGWQWHLGVESSALLDKLGGTIIFNLLVGCIMIDWRRGAEREF